MAAAATATSVISVVEYFFNFIFNKEKKSILIKKKIEIDRKFFFFNKFSRDDDAGRHSIEKIVKTKPTRDHVV
jgi:hypothetical protein